MRIIFDDREVIFNDCGRQIFVFHKLAFFHYLKKCQYMNANICLKNTNFRFEDYQRLFWVISEMHEEKTNICLEIHKYLYFNNHSIRICDLVCFLGICT